MFGLLPLKEDSPANTARRFCLIPGYEISPELAKQE
jgi:hypothetical protein